MEKDRDRGTRLQCGIDEAGRGPVIGPMVMSIVCGERDKFVRLGARDSKLLSRSRREDIRSKILDQAVYTRSIEITAEELNNLMESKTLNEIEADAASELLKGALYETYVDCFDVNEERGSENLSRNSPVKVHCIHDADRFIPAVSAASILSKVLRDRRIGEIEKEYGPMGSGYPADPRTVDFLRKAIRERVEIDSIVRKKWKTYEKLRKEIEQGKLTDY